VRAVDAGLPTVTPPGWEQGVHHSQVHRAPEAQAQQKSHCAGKGLEATSDGDFFVRNGPGTVKLPPDSAKEYIRTRFAALGREKCQSPGAPNTIVSSHAIHRLPQERRHPGAAAMANHASTRTTQLYDRRCDEGSLDENCHLTIRQPGVQTVFPMPQVCKLAT
jgi:hypothetical protein